MENRPAIFAYNDFRKFLADYYEYEHAADPSYTKASVCRELGLPNSRSYFQDVLNGKFVSDLKAPLFIRMANKEVRAIVHKDDSPAEKVYQLAIALFPQMRKA